MTPATHSLPRLQLLVLLPAEQPHRDEIARPRVTISAPALLPVRGERLVLREDALHAADQIGRGHELRDGLRPARQHRRGNVAPLRNIIGM